MKRKRKQPEPDENGREEHEHEEVEADCATFQQMLRENCEKLDVTALETNPNFLRFCLTKRNRQIISLWLLEISADLDWHRTVFYPALDLLDSFFGRCGQDNLSDSVTKTDFGLRTVALACLWLASEYYLEDDDRRKTISTIKTVLVPPCDERIFKKCCTSVLKVLQFNLHTCGLFHRVSTWLHYNRLCLRLSREQVANIFRFCDEWVTCPDTFALGHDKGFEATTHLCQQMNKNSSFLPNLRYRLRSSIEIESRETDYDAAVTKNGAVKENLEKKEQTDEEVTVVALDSSFLAGFCRFPTYEPFLDPEGRLLLN